MRVGVEVGGTFTDLIAIDGNDVRVAKVPSVPKSPEEGVFAALAAANIPLGRVTDLVHGSTVATNAVLERKGGLTAFVTTAGFRDLLLIQRMDRPKIYNLAYQKPVAVVERRDVIEIGERMLSDGSVAMALDEASALQSLKAALSARPFKAVAVCFLNAWANPAHEQKIAELIKREFPELYVSCSSEISREFREYERASTTALSAYVQPIIDSYLGRFESRLEREGFRGHFSIMQSNGGRLPATAIRRNAITALFSGPAAGVIGAIRQTGASGYRNLITFDMGGTSTDVCLVTDGKPLIAAETAVDGLPIRTPVVDIASVGAGGGSIVWRDSGGMLRVGPRSSGADPGPACYGRGGAAPTITDAHVIRGTIQPESFLGGRMRLDVDAAQRVFAPLAKEFGMSLEAIADSAIRLADANVVRAIQLISTELGRDPRDYVLVPFGGAGPLHAGRIAEDLGITTIVVPQNAGVLSAFGLLAADYSQFETVTRRIVVDEATPDAVRGVFGTLRDDLMGRLRANGLQGELEYSFTLQMRFVGQAFEVSVPVDPARLATLAVKDLYELFDEANRLVYMQGGVTGKKIEIVGFRAGATAPEQVVLPPKSAGAAPRPVRMQPIHENREARECTVATRGAIGSLRSGQVDVAGGVAGMDGPLLVEDETSTIYVPPGWRAVDDPAGNLILKRI
ncbi:MAG: hydantoinase/oxoprolinase family protein [Betaproteobacteria bacterium]|nr:hydantoinase/oxoprolinase family protein [Betaproteobacteria bacterium]